MQKQITEFSYPYCLLELLRAAVIKRASDIHLSAGKPPFIRVDGDLKSMATKVLTATLLEEMLFTLLSESQQQKFQQLAEIDFAYTIDNIQRFRVNAYHHQQGIGIVFRVITTQIPTLAQLGLPVIFENLGLKKQGLLLLTGPTGSGKSTSLAAFINYLNETQAKHILTLEDPVEWIYHSQQSLITQRQIERDTHSFQTALRAALREDPDIICITELRDLESIRLALTAAETGHLVLATLHTDCAPKTLNRIIDVFPGNEKESIRALLSESLIAVIAQQLYKNPTADGRIAIFEILINTPAIGHLIRENKIAQIYSVMQTNQALGMCTFEQYRTIKQINKGG